MRFGDGTTASRRMGDCSYAGKMQDKKHRVSFFEKKFLTNLERGFTIAQVRQEDLRRAAISLWWCRILKVKENVE